MVCVCRSRALCIFEVQYCCVIDRCCIPFACQAVVLCFSFIIFLFFSLYYYNLNESSCIFWTLYFALFEIRIAVKTLLRCKSYSLHLSDLVVSVPEEPKARST